MRRSRVLIPIYLWVGASLCLHIVSYFGTTDLAARRARDEARQARARGPASSSNETSASEVEFSYTPPPATPPPPAEPSTVPPTPTEPRPPDEHRPRQVATPTPPRPVPPPPAPVPLVLAQRPPPPPPPPPRTPNTMQSVDQENHDNQPRPDDPAFLAQSNNNVREQTVAAARNLNRNDPEPQVGGAPSQNHGDRPGNGARDVSADERDVSGERRAPVTSPTPPSRPATTARVSTAGTPGAGAAATSASAPRAAGRPGRAGSADPAAAPGAAASSAPAVVAGLTRPVLTAPGGSEGVSVGAEGNPAAGAGSAGQNSTPGQNGQGGQGGDAARRVGIRGRGAQGALAELSPTATTYESVYGPEAQEERRVAQERRSQARGNYTDSWRVNRAAIENYTPRVRVGTQTALRTAQSPFAAYLSGMHRRIHRLFADGFLADLEGLPSNNPLNDTSLVTTLEIVLERDGRIAQMGVARTSGNMAFDVASLNAVRRSAPFGTAPAQIISGDGRVYLHWAFYRNERQCGTFNAEPYLLPHPGEPPTGPAPRTVPLPRERIPTGPSDRLGVAPPALEQAGPAAPAATVASAAE